MGATIKLYYTDRNSTYKEWELIPERLLIVEDIASYLATKSAYTLSNFQYIKNELELGINVDLSQSYAQPKATLSFKYVSIQNADELIHYYFVKKVIWRSKSAVRFELVLDVLNTFEENKDYTFKANTRIIREHKDRFVKGSNDFVFTGTGVYGQGQLSPNDSVYLALNTSTPVFSGKFVSASGGVITINFPLSVDIAQVKAWLTLNSASAIHIVKNSSNYYVYNNCSYVIDYGIFYRKIDYVSEGINPLLIRKSKTAIEEDETLLNQNWYLLYRNQNDPSDSLVNPVECFLIPEEETDTAYAYVASGRIIPSWIEEGKYYYFKVDSLLGLTYTLSNGFNISATSAGQKTTLVIYKTNGLLNVLIVLATYSSGTCVVKNSYSNIEYITADNVPTDYNKDDNLWETTFTNYYTNITYPYTFNNSGTASKLDPVSKIDKTDAKNIKLIKIPYCPFDFVISSNKIQVSASWEYVSLVQSGGGTINCLKLKNLSTKLEHDINSNSLNPFKKLYVGRIVADPASSRLPLSSMYESKLYHSEFYSPSYVYDSFTFKPDLERCNINSYISNGVDTNIIKFTMTSTINSKFLFTFANYDNNKSESNFEKAMPVARNNEEVLYNVPYINYIRTGFNYDVKAKNIQNAANYVGLGLSVASIGASLLAPSVPLKIAGVVASLVSVAMSVKSTIVSAINAENTIKQKITQTQNQASSVVGSDDVDLMSEYSSNRLWYMEYEPTEVMKNLLNDLFFYAGYSSNRLGVPTHNNRINFDYLECEASIEAAATIPNECLAELVNCFKAGITYLHKTSRSTDKWDFEQKYENWENVLTE